jgi:hypothetical protein
MSEHRTEVPFGQEDGSFVSVSDALLDESVCG